MSTGDGLGLGGVAVVLQDSGGKSFTATTAGDGSFRFLSWCRGRTR